METFSDSMQLQSFQVGCELLLNQGKGFEYLVHI